MKDLQLSIERSTVLFDEQSIYKTSMDLFDKLTSDPVTLEKRSSNLRNMLVERIKDDYIIDVLNSLNVYTVEVLVIYALGQIFNDLEKNSPVVKATTLVDKLGRIVLREKGPDNSVYTLESEDEDRNIENVVNMDEKCKTLGGEILNILISKGLLVFIDHPTDNRIVSKPYKKYLYVKCLYDLNLVPVKFNLPMVVPPIPWHIEKKESDKTGKSVITALRGGYLTDSVDVYYRYRLISSKNPELFKLRMTVRSEEDYLPVISLLQSVGFRIDDSVVGFLTKNMNKLIENRLISDEDFIGVDPDSFVSELKNSVDFNYRSLLQEFMIESHKARNEQNVLSMAKAYSGYDLYFPAFQDFRGRVYRTGIFNLHECDLYRSILVFKGENPSKKLSLREIPSSIKVATAKRYSSSFKSDEESIKWFDMWYSNLKDKDIDDYVIESMRSAKDPFQFMRKALLTLKGGCFEAEPVFMDASSSAYQIMAYLLQDTQIAFKTNLINGDTRKDLYMILREDYIKYLRDGNHLAPRLEPFFTRKLIKNIFMPITYGKTVKAIADDLYEVLCNQISYKSCMRLGKESFNYWCIRYRELHNLLKLFGGVGFLCSSLGRSVKLSTPLFYSYQDYRKFEKQSVWIYSNHKGKEKRTRHKISFNVLTTKRNVMKSKCATFANFIHQKDALVAINTIRSFYETYGESPIYTVHDCFVSNYAMSEKMADIYKETMFKSLGNPMELINMFFFYNLIVPNYPNYMSSDYADDRLEFMIHNPISPESHCLCKSDPIPVEHLKIFVLKWIELKAKSLGVTKTNKFEERAHEVIECYNNYVRSLCGRVIERVYGNTDFAKELIDQRITIKKRMSEFRYICFNKLNGKKNYSLT